MEDFIASLDIELVSYLAKKTRVDAGRIIDDVCHKLSRSTVSNLENRKGNPSLKALAQYLTNLGLSKEVLLVQMKEIQQEIDDLHFQIEIAEVLVDEKEFTEARAILDKMRVVDFHPLATKIRYILGRYFYAKDDFTTAKALFFEVIDLYQKNNYDQPNLLPACYNTLSSCYYYEEDIDHAFRYVNMGLSHVQENKTKPELKYLLTANKILHLKILGQTELAFELINSVWNHINEVEPVKVKLNFYKFRSQLLKNAKQYQEAIECAKKGIYIARKNKDRDRQFGLLIVLGTIYLEFDGYAEKAKTCFDTVALFEDIRYPRRLVDAHVYLGILHARSKQWKNAEYHLAIAQQISEEQEVDIRRRIKLMIVYGNMMRSQQKYTNAANLYQQANEISQQKQLPSLQADVLFELLRCHIALGNEDDFHQTSKELFKIQAGLNQKSNVHIYETASPSFTTR